MLLDNCHPLQQSNSARLSCQFPRRADNRAILQSMYTLQGSLRCYAPMRADGALQDASTAVDTHCSRAGLVRRHPVNVYVSRCRRHYPQSRCRLAADEAAAAYLMCSNQVA